MSEFFKKKSFQLKFQAFDVHFNFVVITRESMSDISAYGQQSLPKAAYLAIFPGEQVCSNANKMLFQELFSCTAQFIFSDLEQSPFGDAICHHKTRSSVSFPLDLWPGFQCRHKTFFL